MVSADITRYNDDMSIKEHFILFNFIMSVNTVYLLHTDQ